MKIGFFNLNIFIVSSIFFSSCTTSSLIEEPFAIKQTEDLLKIKKLTQISGYAFSYGVGDVKVLTVTADYLEVKGVFFDKKAEEYGLILLCLTKNGIYTTHEYKFSEKEIKNGQWYGQHLPFFTYKTALDKDIVSYTAFPYRKRKNICSLGFPGTITNPNKKSGDLEILSFRVSNKTYVALVATSHNSGEICMTVNPQNRYTLSVMPVSNNRFLFHRYLCNDVLYHFQLTDGKDTLEFDYKTADIHFSCVPCRLPLLDNGRSAIALPDDPECNLIWDITHPSVLYFSKPWNGSRLWMAATPYPTALTYKYTPNLSGEAFENTHVFYPEKSFLGSKESINRFCPIENNPIINKPARGFNSDSELVSDETNLYAMTRNRYGQSGKSNVFFVQKSSDGHNWSDPVCVLRTGNGEKAVHSVSPALLYRDKKFLCYIFEQDASAKTIDRIDLYEARSLMDEYSLKFVASGKWDRKDISPWHGDVFLNLKKTYMVFSSNGYLYLALSNNSIDWEVFPAPLSPSNSFYRPSAYVDDRGDLIVYSSVHGVFNEKCPEHYPSGNNIVRLNCGNFKTLLRQLQQVK